LVVLAILIYWQKVGFEKPYWAVYLNSGNVGIGTTNPQQTLNVVGHTNLSGLCVAEDTMISMADGSKKKSLE